MLTFSASFVSQFKKTHPELRYGQEFHQWAKLDKITNPEDKHYCDMIYNADSDRAKSLIEFITDNTQ